MNLEVHEDSSVAEEHEDCLPFALAPTAAEALPCSPIECSSPLSPTMCPPVSPNVSHLSTGCRQPPEREVPALTSSIVSSNPADGDDSQVFASRSAEYFASDSLSQNRSRYLEAGASLLLPNSTTGSVCTLHLHPSVASHESCSSSSQDEASCQSVGFSQLLKQVSNDDHRKSTHTSVDKSETASPASHRLPVLPEDQTTVGTSGSGSTLPSPMTPPIMSPQPFRESQPTLMASSFQQSNIISAASASFNHRPERHLAHLAGATVTRTSDTSFQVAVDISSSCSLHDAMDVVGNPERLGHWCESIPSSTSTLSSLVITQRSEARTSQPRRGEYEGEWMEACTTSSLVPPRNSSRALVLKTHQMVKSALGFPTLGKIVMFVERTRGQVGLTIGPLPGGMQVSHQLKIEQVSGCKIRISDQVRLRRAESQGGDNDCCGGCFDAFAKAFFLPTLEDYMDQVLSSMARLRFLVENGETQGGYVPPTRASDEGMETEALLSP